MLTGGPMTTRDGLPGGRLVRSVRSVLWKPEGGPRSPREVAHFERAFRRWTGATPAAYRRS
jgi:hypothetical protein